MGRRKLSKETVVVSVDGELMAWTDGYFSGNQKYINQAKRYAERGDKGYPPKIHLGHDGPWVTPGNGNALAAAAAMVAIKPMRSIVITAPAYVFAVLDRGIDGDTQKPEELPARLLGQDIKREEGSSDETSQEPSSEAN